MSIKSKIINFFGGPGIGKSTQAAGLYTLMKKNGMSVELTYEFPKILAWDENLSAIKDQFYITANQHRNITRLYGKVDYIIIDSPILFGMVYKNKYGTSYPQGISKEIDQSLKNILETNKVDYMELRVSDDLTKKLYNKLFN